MAGREASEIDDLKAVLKWDPSRVLFVDSELGGLAVVEKTWPEANTFYGDVREILPDLREEGIGFANMDFMGFLRPEIEEVFSMIGESLNPGGIVSYTFGRGRETPQTYKYWIPIEMEVVSYLEENPELREMFGSMYSRRGTKDYIRFIGYSLKMKKLLGKDFTHLVSLIQYRAKKNGGYSMGMLAFQYVPLFMQNLRWRDVLRSNEFCGRV